MSYNKYLRPIMIDVLSAAMRDTNLENRRSALNTFNAAARHRPGLIIPYMHQLLPLVMDQAIPDPSLIHEVSMGPFKHKVDDGLEVRKSAYETLYSLMEIAPRRIDLVALYDRVVAGIGDDNGIRSLCSLMILKLMTSAPDETSRRLEALSEKFRAVLGVQLKETAVRHEHEKNAEAKKGVVKLSLALQKAFPGDDGANVKWVGYLEDMRRDQHTLVREVEREV